MSEGLLLDRSRADEAEWESSISPARREEALYLELDGWEGPLDLLLDLARR